MNVFIATPAFEGKVHIQYVDSLIKTINLLKENNIDATIFIAPGSSLLVLERNKILNQFLLTKCTHILCIDADVGWPAECVVRLLNYNLDMVGGLCPQRTAEKKFICMPTSNKYGMIIKNEDGLIKMDYIGASFMLMKRIVIERMISCFQDLYYTSKDPLNKDSTGYCLFNTEVWNGEFWGEDYVFCRRARESKTEIWVDPDIEFDHGGFNGNFSNFIKERNKK